MSNDANLTLGSFTASGEMSQNLVEAPWKSDWANRRRLIIDNNKVGQALYNYPVRVRLRNGSGTNGQEADDFIEHMTEDAAFDVDFDDYDTGNADGQDGWSYTYAAATGYWTVNSNGYDRQGLQLVEVDGGVSAWTRLDKTWDSALTSGTFSFWLKVNQVTYNELNIYLGEGGDYSTPNVRINFATDVARIHDGHWDKMQDVDAGGDWSHPVDTWHLYRVTFGEVANKYTMEVFDTDGNLVANFTSHLSGTGTFTQLDCIRIQTASTINDSCIYNIDSFYADDVDPDVNKHKVLFTSDDGLTALKAEFVRFDRDYRIAEYWVEVPTILTSSPTVIYMYWDSTKADQADVADVGDSPATEVWDEVDAALHLDETGTGAVDEYLDSTGNHNGTGSPPSLGGYTEGGKGQDFDGVSDYIKVNDGIVSHSDFYGSFTFRPDSVGQIATVLDLRGDVNFYIEQSNTRLYAKGSSGGTDYSVMHSTVLSPNTLYFVAFSYDHSEGEVVFVINDISTVGSMVVENTYQEHTIGNNYAHTAPFDGIVDEVRYYNGTRTTNYMLTEYYNVMDDLMYYGANASTYGDVSFSLPAFEVQTFHGLDQELPMFEMTIVPGLKLGKNVGDGKMSEFPLPAFEVTAGNNDGNMQFRFMTSQNVWPNSINGIGHAAPQYNGTLPAIETYGIWRHGVPKMHRQLPAFEVTATANEVRGDVEVELPKFEVSGAVGFGVDIELPGLDVSGTVSQVSASGTLTLPAFTLASGQGGYLDKAIGAFTLTSSAIFGDTGSVSLDLPEFEVTSKATAHKTGDVSVELPKVRVVAGGSVQANVDSTLQFKLNLTASGHSNLVQSISLELPKVSVTASAIQSTKGDANLVLPTWLIDNSSYGHGDTGRFDDYLLQYSRY